MPDQSPQSQGGQASTQSDYGNISAAEIEKYIEGMDFPVGKQDLVQHVRDEDAPKEVIDFMGRFPEQQYGSPIDVSQAVSQVKQ